MGSVDSREVAPKTDGFEPDFPSNCTNIENPGAAESGISKLSSRHIMLNRDKSGSARAQARTDVEKPNTAMLKINTVKSNRASAARSIAKPR